MSEQTSSGSLKGVSQSQIEIAISKALHDLTGGTFNVSIIRLDNDPKELTRFERAQMGSKKFRLDLLDLYVTQDLYPEVHEENEDNGGN